MGILRRRDPVPACPESHAAYGPLAEVIAARIEERTATTLESADETVASVIRGITQDRVDERVRTVFDALSPTAQWEILAAAFDDDAIRGMLRQRYERQALAADPSKWVDLLVHDARKTQRVPATSFLAGVRIVLYLYNPRLLAAKPNDVDLLDVEPDRRIELEAEGKDILQVWDDRISSKWDDRYPLRTTTRTRLGVGPEGRQAMTERVLCRRRPVQYVENGHVHTLYVSGRSHQKYVYLGLGRLTIDGREIFFDPPTDSA